jgi:hypothetical protein
VRNEAIDTGVSFEINEPLASGLKPVTKRHCIFQRLFFWLSSITVMSAYCFNSNSRVFIGDLYSIVQQLGGRWRPNSYLLD